MAELRRVRPMSGTPDVVRCLGRVVPGVGFDSVRGAAGMVASQISDLCGLRVHDLGRILELLVDDFFIAYVNQGAEVNGGDSDKRETPEREKFDQPVRDYRCCKGCNSMDQVLGEEDALELDDEKVDELLNVF